MGARVLLVSKAIVPPYHDGTVCMAHALCAGLTRYVPTVMTTASSPPPYPHVLTAPVYPAASRFSPPLADNVRVLAHLLVDRHHALWHFFFAPNPRSSSAAKLLRRLRSVPTVQTVASRPRVFAGVQRLLFGDQVVALSRHTADALVKGGASHARLHVIPPPVLDLSRSPDQQRQARTNARLEADAPLVLYAGDLEFSRGAHVLAQAAPAIIEQAPDAQIVFACRAKSPRAAAVRDRLVLQLRPLGSRVRFVGQVADLPALLASAAVAPFVVDDLYGKVDLPYAVLEACLLRVPVVVAKGGPLEELPDAPAIEPGDASRLAALCVELIRDSAQRQQLGKLLREHVKREHDPKHVAARYQELYDSVR